MSKAGLIRKGGLPRLLFWRDSEVPGALPIHIQCERLESRRLLANSISGTIYADYDRDGTRDSGEPGLIGWQVYLDTNDNGIKDAAEVSTFTDSAGGYQFTNLPAGNYIIRQALPDGWEQTSPTSAAPIVASAAEADSRVFAQDELLFASSSRHPLRELASYLSSHLRDFASAIDFDGSSNVVRADGETISLLRFNGRIDVSRIANELTQIPSVRWVSPNYLYSSKFEYTPDDPSYLSQYHHSILQSTSAWNVTRGDPSVTIAVIDEGVDWTHPDLSANIWSNSDEVAGNGVDDDHNGFIDDIRGWDLADNDNNPAPDFLSDSHGTHVAGIAAARVDNQLGIAGVAGRCTIMPVRAINPAKFFSSATLAASYRYAVDNGAKIVVSSYSTDEFVNDPVYKAGLAYLYDHGALHFNSAGNSNFADPPRQAFEQSILVAATDATDTRNDQSNFGWGIDVSAPGTSILSTIPGNQYEYMTGTSMAAPMAAGVAALIWSAFPTYTREQVAARLLGCADSIDAFNTGFAGKLGSGRINAFRALTGALPAPRFRTDSIIGLPANNGTTFSSPSAFSIDVASVFSAAAVADQQNWRLVGDGPDNAFGTSDDVAIPLTLQTQYAVGTNRLRFNMPSLSADRYRFSALSGTVALRDPFNQALDGDSNGVAGGDFNHEFTVLPAPAAARVTLAGSNVGNIDFASADRTPLRISSAKFAYLANQSFTLTFDKPVVSSLTISDIVLRNQTTGATINPVGMTISSDANGKYQLVTAGNASAILPDGRYVVTIGNSQVHDAFGNKMPASFEFGFFVLGGDANRDSTVDSLDFNTLAAGYGGHNQIFSHGDFDYDRDIDTSDFNILAGAWGKSLAAT
jgi:subtilisin family serine protease